MPLLKYDGSVAAETAQPATQLFGTDGVESYVGTAAAEGFWGGPADVMAGGAGDDSYWLKTRQDQVIELAGAGVDKITAWHSVSLADHPNVENINVVGDRLYVAGNALDNIVEGGAGAQQVYGAAGQDVLVGGAGADVFIVYKGEGNDVLQDFSAAEDKVRLKAGFTSFSEVQSRLSQVGSDVKLDLGGGDGLIFRNLTVGQLTAGNFQLELKASTLGAQTFADEFNSLSLWDPESAPNGVWRTDYGYQGAQGVGSYTLVSNDEKQIYTSPYFRDHSGDFAESPFSVSGGVLSITATPSTNPELFGYGYTSGLITTKPSFAQTYGYFEIRADLPEATGAWPAFWMLPADGSWPPELDIMEALTYDPHGAWTTQHSSATGSHASNGQLSYVPDTADGFHTYGALWGPSEIVWYADNVEVFRTATPADMNKPMFMLANLALGGWGGAIDAADLPAEFKIDYIRAYAWANPAPTPAPAPAPPPTPAPAPATAPAPAPMPAAEVGKLVTATAGGSTLQGGAGADTLQGGDGRDYVRGGDGADRLSGGEAFDDLHGNIGHDTVSGGGDGDWVVGGQGDDQLFGDDGADVVLGNLGNDLLYGGTGNDVVRGGQADDVLFGEAGDDYLSGDRGSDTITGGAGADTFHSFEGAGLDRILDFNGAEGDRLQLLAGTSWTVTQVGADTIIDLGGGGQDQVVLVGVQASSLGAGWIFAG
jgi:beta-glucanase (GH16 family)/Ca2+-binding RTX toxin-like protein